MRARGAPLLVIVIICNGVAICNYFVVICNTCRNL